MFDSQTEISRRLQSSGVALNDIQGLSLPEIAKPLVFDVVREWDRRSELAKFGIDLVGRPAEGNLLVFDAETPFAGTQSTVQLLGGPDNLLIFAAGHRLAANIRLEGRHQTFAICPCSTRPFHSNSLILRGAYASVFIGQGTTSNGATILVDGANTSVVISDDCMLSHGIEISASDSHAIFDIETLRVLPTAESVFVDRHVWLGSHVSITKGVRLGKGSIVGTRAVVTSNVPPRTLWAGSPARQLRPGVTWTRDRYPSQEQMRDVVSALE